jgi:hypothetical protein
MKSRTLTCVFAITLFAALALPLSLTAQSTRYKLIDIGTVGGPNSLGGAEFIQTLNNRGIVAVCSETTIPDPNFPNASPLLAPLPLNPDPLILHTSKWQDGALVDLGALAGINSSCPDWIRRKWVSCWAFRKRHNRSSHRCSGNRGSSLEK